VRQRGDAHPRGHHLNQQQRVIDAFQLRADAGRLQEVAPDIQATALHGINQQRFRGQILRRDARLHGQRMLRRQHQAHFIIKHRRIVQAAARQDIGGHHQIQLALLQRRLRVEGHAGMEVHLHMRPAGAEILQRRRQPLNTAVAFDSERSRVCCGSLQSCRARRFAAAPDWPAAAGSPLRRKAQRLALTHKQTEAKALFQIAELVRQGGLGLVQGRRRARQ
jgi:hypothetical protein